MEDLEHKASQSQPDELLLSSSLYTADSHVAAFNPVQLKGNFMFSIQILKKTCLEVEETISSVAGSSCRENTQ